MQHAGVVETVGPVRRDHRILVIAEDRALLRHHRAAFVPGGLSGDAASAASGRRRSSASRHSRSTSRSMWAAGCRPSRSLGLADAAVLEARERVRSALRVERLRASQRPNRREPRPGPLRKHGTGFDLPIALGHPGRHRAAAVRHSLQGVVAVGELSLDGGVRPVPGLLAHALGARDAGRDCFSARRDDRERASLSRACATCRSSTSATLRRGTARRRRSRADRRRSRPVPDACDFAEVAGQESAVRALVDRCRRRTQRAAGRPAGLGQDDARATAARRSCRRCTRSERLETALVHSVAGLDERRPLCGRASLPRAAPLGVGRRTRRRRHAAAAGRGVARAQRGALPRRDAGVRSGCAPVPAPTARGRRHRRRASGGPRDVPRTLHSRRSGEPLPVRLPRRPGDGLPLPTVGGRALRRPDRWTADGPDRPRGRSRPARARPAARRSTGRCDVGRRCAPRSSTRGRAASRRGGAILRLSGAALLARVWADATEVASALEHAAAHYHLSGRGVTRLLRVARTIADLERPRDGHAPTTSPRRSATASPERADEPSESRGDSNSGSGRQAIRAQLADDARPTRRPLRAGRSRGARPGTRRSSERAEPRPTGLRQPARSQDGPPTPATSSSPEVRSAATRPPTRPPSAQAGATVAVMAGGRGRRVPEAVAASLMQQMLERGAVVSEHPWGTEPQRWTFRTRNRIIAGLCDGATGGRGLACRAVRSRPPSTRMRRAERAVGPGLDLRARVRGLQPAAADRARPRSPTRASLRDLLAFEIGPPDARPESWGGPRRSRIDDPCLAAVRANPLRPDDLARALGHRHRHRGPTTRRAGSARSGRALPGRAVRPVLRTSALQCVRPPP